MSNGHDTVSISVDNRSLKVRQGQTILEVARDNDIYIPALCAHKDLTPFGGCRMCIVEVEGMRGLPTSCTTPVEEGMIIRTHTAQVHAVRQEILQLILSEHTSSCLICDEQDECKTFSTTIRKTGVTTGCRWCPNDGQCELQDVVEHLGLKEIGYPISYRHLRVEKEDPFYDRDYNLCILCGRCVRMCQDIRAAGTLAFCQRGRRTVIGPAFGRSHLEAGCEFCGACVAVCPTGALSEKAGKWEGKPEREEITTCPFCGVGCQVRLLVKGDAVIGSRPANDPLVNNGQLCVKGRFCMTELMNGHQRLTTPYAKRGPTNVEISWAEAVSLAAEKLSTCAPEEFGMVVSPNCTNEDLYVAQKFARVAMRSGHIDTSARVYYGTGFGAYLDLLGMSVPLTELKHASTILCVGLDTRFGRSVVGVKLRQALKRGAQVITIHPWQHSLGIISDLWLQPMPGTELGLLRSLALLTSEQKAGISLPKTGEETADFGDKLRTAALWLTEASAPVILVGSEYLQYDQSAEILKAISEVARNIGAGVLPLPAQNNLFGSVLMGAYPELLPGGFSSTNQEHIRHLTQNWNGPVPGPSSPWNSGRLSPGNRLKVLCLVGEFPPEGGQVAEFVIFQNIYPPDNRYQADLVLPAAAFAEVEGTFINGEGRVQPVQKAVNPPGQALPDWQILTSIAQAMGIAGFEFADAAAIRREMATVVGEVRDFMDTARQPGPLKLERDVLIHALESKRTVRGDQRSPFVLSASLAEHTHRGFSLATWVEGAQTLFPEGVVHVHPTDAAAAGIEPGDEVIVTSVHFEKTWRASIRNEQQEGTLHVVLGHGESINPNPDHVSIRKRDV